MTLEGHRGRLAVVIPTLDEADEVARLLGELAAQADVGLEVVVVDGGSRDQTRARVLEAAAGFPHPLRWLAAPRGRGAQMNAGAAATLAPDLLFLHADSTIADRDLLARAWARLDGARRDRGTDRVAGHFGLRFVRRSDAPSHGFYFLEAKSRRNEATCILGDQGLLLARAYFDELRGFDTALPYLEDVRLAPRIAGTGAWILLPGALGTSARRLEQEGYLARQLLNAVILACNEAGFDEFLADVPGLYRAQAGATRLDLLPLYAGFWRHLRARGAPAAAGLWLRAGRWAARTQLWQLAFAVDCRRNFDRGVPPGAGDTPWLRRFGALQPVWESPIGTAVATAAGFFLFTGLEAALRVRRRVRAS